MKKTSSIAFALLFSAVLSIGYKWLKACGGGEWSYDLASLYTPETAGVDSTLSPMFYSDALYYSSYDAWEWNQEQALKGWLEYMQSEISEEALRFYLFSKEGDKEFAAIIQGSSSSKSFPLLKWSTPKMKDLKTFLRLAKEVDKAYSRDWWAWNYKPENIVRVRQETIDQITQHYKSETNEILKEKWWFQCVKAKYYSQNIESVIAFMNETESQMPRNYLYYRALGYLGGAYHRLGNFPMANVQYTKLMTLNSPMRWDAIFSYHALSKEDFEYAYGMLTNDDERCAMLALQAYYTDEKEIMKTIYAIQPKSEMLDLLLTRRLNKMEMVLTNTDRENYREYISDVKKSIDPELIEFVNRVNDEGKIRDADTWNIAAAYVNALSGNNKKAEEQLNKVFQHGNKMERDQATIISVVNEIMRVGFENKDFWSFSGVDASAFEKRIYPHLKWCIEQGKVESYDSYDYWDTSAKQTELRADYVYYWAKRVMGLMYAYEIKGELCSPNNKYYQSSYAISEMKEFLKREHEPFEELLAKTYFVNIEDIEMYEGLLLVYSGQLDAAKEHFVKSKLSNEELLADPFVAGIQDCHDCDHENYHGRKWTRLTTLNRMIQLQQNILRNTDMYYSAISLGNAYYNISYHGNARVFYETKLMFSWGNGIDDFHSKILTSSAKAEDYYRLALAHAQSDEQRAKCEYLIAKCDRNEFYNFDFVNNEVDFLAWDGFQNLKSKYSNTKFYNDVIRECGYFRTYLSKAR